MSQKLSASPAQPTQAPACAAPSPSHWLLSFYDRHRWVLLGIVALFYLAGFNAQWRPEPDSALYLSIGRNLALGLGYTYQGQLHNLVYPGWPWVLAGLFKLFGPNHLWPAHVLMLACTLGSLALFYRLIHLVADRPTAVLMTCLAALSETIFRYAFEMRNDTPFLLGVMAFLVGYESLRCSSAGAWRWWDLTLLVVGFAIATVMRPAVVALLGAVLIDAAVATWRVLFTRSPVPMRRTLLNRIGPLVGAGIVLLVALGFYLLDPRRTTGETMGLYEENFFTQATTHFQALASAALTQNLPRLLNSEITSAAFGTRLGWSGLNILGSLAVLLAGIGLFRVRILWGAFFVLTILMILLVPRPEGRYLLAIMPLTVYGWWQMAVWVQRRAGQHVGTVAMILLLALWAVPNTVRCAWVALEQRQIPFLDHYRKGEYASVPTLADVIARTIPPGVPVAAPSRTGRILSYLSGRNVVDSGAVARIDPHLRHFWVILPERDKIIEQTLRERGLVVGPTIAQVPRRGRRPPWTLHRTLEAP